MSPGYNIGPKRNKNKTSTWKIKWSPKESLHSMRFSMYTKLLALGLCGVWGLFQFECLLHLQSQAAQALHLKLDEFEFSRYFIEIDKGNTSLNLPIVCSCGGPVWQNVLPLNYLKVGFKWVSTQCCAFAICISSVIHCALTICKDISVKNSDKWYWSWKRLRKEKCVGDVPFAKHQKTRGRGLKQVTLCLKRKPGIGQTRLWWLQKLSVVSVKAGKRECLERYYFFCRKISTGMNRFIWILPGITGFSI